jgi:lipopolysaccharide export system protein LptA
MSSRALRLPLVGLALLFTGTEVAGQQSSCDLISSRRVLSTQTNQARVSYVAAPRFECTDGTRIEADSSVTFEATSFTQLFGNVVFRDGQRELFADRAQYFSRVGRLQAQGSVLLIDLEDGSSLAGEDLVLLQEGDNRAEEDVTVREGRPHARLVPGAARDSTTTEGSAGTPGPDGSENPVPYDVDADLIHLVGDRLFQARGRVQITHESLQAYGDSLEFQQDIGWLTLFDNARLLSQDTVSGDTLDVRGDTITMDLPDDLIEEIEARGGARLLAEDVDMRGPIIRLAFEDEELERVFAVRPPAEEEATPEVVEADPAVSSANPVQPQAVAEDFVLTGDSIQADVAEDGLERVVATGDARGVSTARDSLNTEATDELIRYDWIEGDTIIATFIPVSADPQDPPTGEGEGSGRQMDLLVARGEARSFYRSAPDSPTDPVTDSVTDPAPGSVATNGPTGPRPLELNYVIGDEIRLYMKAGEVERMEVDNPTGVYLQPRRQVDPTTAPPEPGDATPGSPDTIPGSPGADDAPPAGGNAPPDGDGGTS